MDKIEEYKRYLKKCEMLGVKMFEFSERNDEIWVINYIKNNEQERIVKIPDFVSGVSEYAFAFTVQDIKIISTGLKGLKFREFEGSRLDLSGTDTSKIKSMKNMFRKCYGLKELNIRNIDTSNVEDMYGMFSDCEQLEKIDMSNFDTSKVHDMQCMFAGCSSLIKIDLSNLNTNNVIGMNSMFEYCINLKEIDLSSINTSNLEYSRKMFRGCKQLELIITNKYVKNKLDNDRIYFGLRNECEIRSVD